MADTDVGVIGELRRVAAEYLAELDARRAREDAARAAQERRHVVAVAAEHVAAVFPETLGRVLPAEAWTSVPPASDASAEITREVEVLLTSSVGWEWERPCAMAHLGEEVWVHHQGDRETTLISPCPACGARICADVAGGDEPLAAALAAVGLPCRFCAGPSPDDEPF